MEWRGMERGVTTGRGKERGCEGGSYGDKVGG